MYNYNNYNSKYISDLGDYDDYMIPWVEYQIIKYACENKTEHQSSMNYIKENLLYVTFNFINRNIYERVRKSDGVITSGQIERAQFQHFYNMVCRAMLGRDYHLTHPCAKPLVLACLDARGSRYWKEMNEEIENIHIHSIWMLKPDTKDLFFGIREKALAMLDLDFDQIHVEPFKVDPTPEESLSKLISYTLKFDRFNQYESIVDGTIMMYPLAKDALRYNI